MVSEVRRKRKERQAAHISDEKVVEDQEKIVDEATKVNGDPGTTS